MAQHLRVRDLRLHLRAFDFRLPVHPGELNRDGADNSRRLDGTRRRQEVESVAYVLKKNRLKVHELVLLHVGRFGLGLPGLHVGLVSCDA